MEIDKEVFWDFLQNGKTCNNCFWQGKMNASPIRSEFEVRCMGCFMHNDLPYWEPRWKEDDESS